MWGAREIEWRRRKKKEKKNRPIDYEYILWAWMDENDDKYHD